MENTFFIENKIYYHDTDAGGVVYYGAYMQHLEEGRYEFLKAKGIDLSELIKQGISFPVVHLEIEYKSPARYADKIKIYTKLEKIGDSSVHFSQEIKKDDTVLVKATTIWACVGYDFKKIRVPDLFRQKSDF